MIYGDDFVNMLYLSIDDQKILNMRNELAVPKPRMDEPFMQYGENSMPIDKYGVELFFKDESKVNGNDNGIYGKGDILFTGIVYEENTKLELPFNIKMSDDYDTVLSKIGRVQDFETSMFPQKVWKITRDDNHIYLLYAFFEADYSRLLNFRITAYDESIEN